VNIFHSGLIESNVCANKGQFTSKDLIYWKEWSFPNFGDKFLFKLFKKEGKRGKKWGNSGKSFPLYSIF